MHIHIKRYIYTQTYTNIYSCIYIYIHSSTGTAYIHSILFWNISIHIHTFAPFRFPKNTINIYIYT